MFFIEFLTNDPHPIIKPNKTIDYEIPVSVNGI
jgi:hypothetical protein